MNKNFPIAPGYYKFMVGDIEVICVSDGILSSDINAVVGISVEQARSLFDKSNFPTDIYCNTNNFIIRSQSRTALVDTGAGSFIYDTSGKMLENAAGAGIEPSAIDTILFTHIHPDHCSGLMDKNWNKVFPNAVIKMHRAEFEFWLSADPMSKKIEHVKHEADHVIRFMTPYLDQIELFDEGEIFPGINAVPLPGHTPGHTGYLISSQGKELLIWGDIVHWPAVQFAVPDASVTYDVDSIQARATRWEILNKVSTSGLLVAGMHLYFPGITRIEKGIDSFVMIPVTAGVL